MNRIKNSLVAFGGLSLLIGVIAFVTPRPTRGQGGDPVGPPKPVKVVNTPAEPVPVTGTTTITGDVTLAPGTSVAINNTPDAPVPARDVDNPARQPFQMRVEYGFNPAPAPSVPNGKLFVIEYVSGSLRTETPVGTEPFCRLITIGFGTRPNLQTPILEHYFTPNFTGSATGIGGVTVSFLPSASRRDSISVLEILLLVFPKPVPVPTV